MASKSGVDLLDELIGELSAAVAASGTAEVKGNKTKAAKTAAAPPPAPTPAPTADVSVNSLDLRVGKIVSVKRHETADKLYCEMIDVGEEEPRAIASGLVPHYSLDEMEGRRLIVVANLKPRNLVGFKSFGMVLCAAKVDPTTGNEKVEFVDPPIDAPIGSRVVANIVGTPVSEPLSSAQVEKRKAFEIVAADLKVGIDGVARWRDANLCVGDKPCTAPTLRDALIR